MTCAKLYARRFKCPHAATISTPIVASVLNPELGKRRAKEVGMRTLMSDFAAMRSCTVSTRSDCLSCQLACCRVAEVAVIACPLAFSWMM